VFFITKTSKGDNQFQSTLDMFYILNLQLFLWIYGTLNKM